MGREQPAGEARCRRCRCARRGCADRAARDGPVEPKSLYPCWRRIPRSLAGPRRAGPSCCSILRSKRFKKLLPYAGLGDEDVAAVALVADAAQIAERAQRIQGARDHGLRHAEHMGEAADRMRPGGEVDQQHQRHLPVGEIGLARPHIADQGLHPAPESAGLPRVLLQIEMRLVSAAKPVRTRFVS